MVFQRSLPLLSRLKAGWPAFAVLLLALLATGHVYLWNAEHHRQRVDMLAQAEADQYHAQVTWSLRSYIGLADALSRFFVASESVSQEEFDTYFDATALLERYPGIVRVAYVPRVGVVDVPRFEARARQTYPHYRVTHGAREGDVFPYLHVRALQRSDERAKQGLDAGTDPARRVAMERARDTGLPAFTGKTEIVGGRNGIVLFTPIYRRGSAPATVAGRQAALRGFVSVSLDVDTLFGGIPDDYHARNFALQVYDGPPGAQALLYNSAGRDVPGQEPVLTRRLAGHDQAYSFHYFLKPGHLVRHPDPQGAVILLGGAFLSVLLAALVWKLVHQLHVTRVQRESNDRFEILFERHPEAVYTVHPEGRVTSANSYVLTMLGLPRSALIGRPVTDFVREEDREQQRQMFRQVLSGASLTVEMKFVTAAGEVQDGIFTAIPVVIDGSVTNILVLAHNVTAARRQEEALHTARQMLQLVLDNIPQRVFWKDHELRIIGANKSFLADLEVARVEDIAGRPCDAILPAATERLLDPGRSVLESGRPLLGHEVSAPDREGRIRWLRTNKVPLKDLEGSVIGVLETYEDITAEKRAAEDLHQARQMLQAVLDAIPQAVLWKDRDSVLLGGNRHLLEQLGLHEIDEIVGKTDHDFWPEEAAVYREDDRRVMESGRPKIAYEEPHTLSGRPTRWVRSSKAPLRSLDNRIIGVLVVFEDITRQREMARALEASEKRLQLMIEHSHDAFISTDAAGRVLAWNPQAERLFGWTAAEVAGKDLGALIVPEELRGAHRAGMARFAELPEAGQTGKKLELEALDRAGRRFPVEVTLTPVRGPGGLEVHAFLHDISERKRLERELEALAHYDSLTGVANRHLFHEHLEKAVARARRHGTRLALLYLDLDRFKQINDSYGHHAGDLLLQAFARRIAASVRATDQVGRLGGDEFAVILEDLHSPRDALLVAEKILAAMAPVVAADGKALTLETSIGIAMHTPGAGRDVLLKAADRAMYQAKQAGRGRYALIIPDPQEGSANDFPA